MLRILAVWLCLLVASCDGDQGHSHGPSKPAPKRGAVAAEDAPELRLPLGRLQIGATVLDVVQIEHIEPGSSFEVFADAVEGPEPLATRIWLGDESGVGSRKGLVHEEADGPHAHVDIRVDYDPALHRIWIEVERADGSRERASIAPQD